MSLFKAREWWTTITGYEQFHDLGSLCVANIDNNPNRHDKIIVGNFQGFIRIYEPHPPHFKESHLLLEKQLSSPVLQVAAGKFVSGSSQLHLALLHSCELVVYLLSTEQNDEGLSYMLNLVYKHSLPRTACNMTWGPFGATNGGDQICVQSMDGQLFFYLHDSSAFTCFLPEFLLPGPLRYIPRTDSFVTINSSHSLQTFRYHTLSMASSTTLRTNTGKKIIADWMVNLGEHAIDIKVVSAPSGPTQLLVLGERSLFCFKDNGVLRFMKKLDFNPTCINAYSVQPQSAASTGADGSAASPGHGCGEIQYLLSSDSHQLLVFRDSTLIWAASLDYAPVDMATASFKELRGVIVWLDELGHLTCTYLGTDPTLFTAPTRGIRDLNYQEIDKEFIELNKVIRNAQKGVSVDQDQARLVVKGEFSSSQVRVLEPSDIEGVDQPAAVANGDGKRTGEEGEETEERPIKKVVELKLHLSSSTGPALRDISLNINASIPLTTHPSHFTVPEVSSTHKVEPLVVTVVCTPSLLPTSTSLTVSATYNSPNDQLQVAESSIELPLHLFCQPIFPEKTATYKVTVDVNYCESDLTNLLPASLFLKQTPSNAVGLRYLSGSEVTIVASKNTKRYRLQSNSLPVIGVTLEWLLDRLHRYYSAEKPPFAASFTPPLPLPEYFEVIERHYKLRANMLHCREWLSRHAEQFRAIQKRLLTRFKDKTPVGLANLDTLLDGTYMQLMALSEKNEVFLLELQESSSQLACATQLIITLLRLASGMSEEDYTILKAALSPAVTVDDEQGWEEQVDAAVTHLLRTTLSKSSKEQAVPPNSSLEMPAECQKLKKHIALLCDRICKGYMPSGQKATQSLDNTSKEESGKTPTENGQRQQQQQLSPEADKGAIHRSSSGGFIVSKPDPGILSMGSLTRHNYRGGGRGDYQRQPTLPSLPELEDTPGALQEGEEGEVGGEEGGDGRATEEHSRQQHKLLTTL